MLLQGVVQETKMFAGSQSLLYWVALVAGQQTQTSADKYMSDVYEMLGMTTGMSTRQQTLLESTAKNFDTGIFSRKKEYRYWNVDSHFQVPGTRYCVHKVFVPLVPGTGTGTRYQNMPGTG